MAIGQRTATIDVTTPASTTHTVTKPSGLADGDVVYIWLANNGGSVSAIPTGFSLVDDELTQSNPKYFCHRKVITDAAGEGAWTYTTSSVTKTTICQAFTEVDTTTPEDVVGAGGTNSTGSNTITAAEVTTVTAGAVLVYGGAINSSSNNLTGDGAMTDIGETGSVKKQIVSYELRASAGATGTRTAAAVSNTLAWGAIMFAIRPAAAAPSDIHPVMMRQSISDARTRPRKRRAVQPKFTIPRPAPPPPATDRLHPIPTIVADFRRRIRRGVPAKWHRPLRLLPTTIITVDATASSGSASATTDLTFSATTGAGSNRLLLVALHNRAPFGHSPSDSVIWKGSPLTFAGRAVVNTDHSIELWYMVNPTESSTANVVATFPDTRSVVGGAQHFANVDQTTPIGTIVGDGSNAGTPSATTSTAAVGDMVLSFIQRITNELVEAPGDMTQAYQVNTGSGDVKGAAAYQASDGNRPTTWRYTTSTYWTVLATDLNPAPAASPSAIHITKLRQIFTRFPYRQVQ